MTGYGRSMAVSRPLPFIPDHNGLSGLMILGFDCCSSLRAFPRIVVDVIPVLRRGLPSLLVPFCERSPIMVRYRLQQVLVPWRLVNRGLRGWRRDRRRPSHCAESKRKLQRTEKQISLTFPKRPRAHPKSEVGTRAARRSILRQPADCPHRSPDRLELVVTVERVHVVDVR
jgi:hypothetical protein